MLLCPLSLALSLSLTDRTGGGSPRRRPGLRQPGWSCLGRRLHSGRPRRTRPACGGRFRGWPGRPRSRHCWTARPGPGAWVGWRGGRPGEKGGGRKRLRSARRARAEAAAPLISSAGRTWVAIVRERGPPVCVPACVPRTRTRPPPRGSALKRGVEKSESESEREFTPRLLTLLFSLSPRRTPTKHKRRNVGLLADTPLGCPSTNSIHWRPPCRRLKGWP